MTPAVAPSVVLPAEHLGPVASLVVACIMLAGYATLLVTALVAAARCWWRARIAEAAYRADAPLVPGQVVVHGTVEHAASEEVAVRVEVDQEGSESESSGSWTTSWHERDRRVTVRPFYLRHASGERIRVEPTVEVELIDAMEGKIRVNLTRRVRVAELTAGEAIFALGSLQVGGDPEAAAGYRGGGRGMVLRPRAGGHLLLSSEPLGLRFRRRISLHLAFAVAVPIVAMLVNLGLLAYYSSLLGGQPGRGVITQLKHIVESDSDGDIHHYRVWLRLGEPFRGELVDEVDEEIFRLLQVGMELPARVTVRGSPSQRVGSRATFHLGLLFLLAIPLLIVGLLYHVGARQKSAWYEGSFDEVELGRLGRSREAQDGAQDGVQGGTSPKSDDHADQRQH